MSSLLRIALILASLFTFLYVGRKIKKSQMQLEDALIWIIIPFFLILLSIFPQIAYFFADILGFQASVNFVFLCIIFILLMKLFVLSIKVSQLDNRLRELTQEIAIKQRDQLIEESLKKRDF